MRFYSPLCIAATVGLLTSPSMAVPLSSVQDLANFAQIETTQRNSSMKLGLDFTNGWDIKNLKKDNGWNLYAAECADPDKV